jgi:[CysO sulfur-carrier protein]-S-L-cysteine hydrolase
MAAPFRPMIPRRLHAEMVLQAQKERPYECCGLLAGRIEGGETGAQGRVLRRFPLINAAASPVEFVSEPRSMLTAHKEMRRENLDILGIYHSHPASPPIPSRTDLQRNNFGDSVVNLIVSLQNEVPEIRAWWLGAKDFQEAEVEWID